jgi:hypothetical protein
MKTLSASKSFILPRIVGLFIAVLSTVASAQLIQSPGTQVNLLEVYTSQGCSSCPPAEHWLTRFETDPRLWQQFIPVNFHVDYWDSLGWKDPFAAAKFSTRQRRYEQLSYATSVATPGFILDGRGWNGWFYGHTLPLTETDAAGLIPDPFRQRGIGFAQNK